MDATSYQDIKSSLRQLYLDDPRPWLVGFSIGYPNDEKFMPLARDLRSAHPNRPGQVRRHRPAPPVPDG